MPKTHLSEFLALEFNIETIRVTILTKYVRKMCQVGFRNQNNFKTNEKIKCEMFSSACVP